MFLKDVSNIRTGLVTARKQAKGPENGDFREYRLLSLRCIKEPGVLDVDLAEPYAANDELKQEFLTRQDDILVRLSAPYTAALVNDESAGYVVPSHFAIIRVDKSKVDPAYVLWFLRQQSTLKQIYQCKRNHRFWHNQLQFLQRLENRRYPARKATVNRCNPEAFGKGTDPAFGTREGESGIEHGDNGQCVQKFK